MVTSAALRAQQPLVPRAIERIGQDLVCVHANWDRFELRAAAGGTLEVPPRQDTSNALFHQFHFVAHRYLVCTVGGGVSVQGAYVLDLERGAWLHDLVLGGEIGVLGADDRGLLAIEVNDGVAVWNVERETRESWFPDPLTSGCGTVAFHPGLPLLAGGGFEELVLTDLAGQNLARVALRNGDVTAVAWLNARTLVSGVLGARIHLRDQDLRLVADISMGPPQHDGRNNEVRRLLPGPDGVHFLCLCTDGCAYIANTDTLVARRVPDVQAACFVDASELAVAGVAGLRRIPL